MYAPQTWSRPRELADRANRYAANLPLYMTLAPLAKPPQKRPASQEPAWFGPAPSHRLPLTTSSELRALRSFAIGFLRPHIAHYHLTYPSSSGATFIPANQTLSAPNSGNKHGHLRPQTPSRPRLLLQITRPDSPDPSPVVPTPILYRWFTATAM